MVTTEKLVRVLRVIEYTGTAEAVTKQLEGSNWTFREGGVGPLKVFLRAATFPMECLPEDHDAAQMLKLSSRVAALQQVLWRVNDVLTAERPAYDVSAEIPFEVFQSMREAINRVLSGEGV